MRYKDVSIQKTADKLIKKLRGRLDFVNLEKELSDIGYSVIFYNTPAGDNELNRYNLFSKAQNLKAFTYSSSAKIIFIDNNQHADDKLYLLLHETAHILLKHLGDGKINTRNAIKIDIEADALAYEILNHKKSYKPHIISAAVLVAVLSCGAILLHNGGCRKRERKRE